MDFVWNIDCGTYPGNIIFPLYPLCPWAPLSLSYPLPSKIRVIIPRICIKSSSLAAKVGANSGVRKHLFFIFGNKSISANFLWHSCSMRYEGFCAKIICIKCIWPISYSSIHCVLNELGGPSIIPANGKDSLLY